MCHRQNFFTITVEKAYKQVCVFWMNKFLLSLVFVECTKKNIFTDFWVTFCGNMAAFCGNILLPQNALKNPDWHHYEHYLPTVRSTMVIKSNFCRFERNKPSVFYSLFWTKGKLHELWREEGENWCQRKQKRKTHNKNKAKHIQTLFFWKAERCRTVDNVILPV